VNDTPPALARRLFAELLGTGLLVTVVVGSGIAAQQLSASDVGLQLLENSTATVFGLAALILMLGPVSGAHFNPAVSLADWFLGRRAAAGLTLAEVSAYTVAQCAGAIGGVVATAGLIALIFALARTRRGVLAAPAVGAYIGAAYWFTSSTSFANPAVTVGRMFSDTFAGIAPARRRASSARSCSAPRLVLPSSWSSIPTPASAPTTSSSRTPMPTARP
jgi:glycerol uptake facilitator-like aquaporin